MNGVPIILVEGELNFTGKCIVGGLPVDAQNLKVQLFPGGPQALVLTGLGEVRSGDKIEVTVHRPEPRSAA